MGRGEGEEWDEEPLPVSLSSEEDEEEEDWGIIFTWNGTRTILIRGVREQGQ